MPALLALFAATLLSPAAPPQVGETAPEFRLTALDQKVVALKPTLKKGPVVLVVLRGYPGYQCPFCSRQVGELIANGKEFARRNATVVLVYPGPTDRLEMHANEFLANKSMPTNLRFTIDPGYKFVNQYGLRWDAPAETAYPSAFVIGKNGKVAYARVTREHGNRAPVAELLVALDGLKS